MRRKFTRHGVGHGVRVFVYDTDFETRVKITLAHFIAITIEWFDTQEEATLVARVTGYTLVKLARVNSTYRWGVTGYNLNMFPK